MAKQVRKALGSDVRAYFQANPERIPEGKTIGKRGRFAPEVQKRFNEDNKGSMRYTEGNVKTIPLKVRVESKKTPGNFRNEVRDFPVDVVRAAAGLDGRRGPLPKTALVTAAENLSDKPSE